MCVYPSVCVCMCICVYVLNAGQRKSKPKTPAANGAHGAGNALSCLHWHFAVFLFPMLVHVWLKSIHQALVIEMIMSPSEAFLQ